MAKKKPRNKNLPKGNTALATKSKDKASVSATTESNDKVQLEKSVPMLISAFENASKTYKNKGNSLDLEIDPDYLKALIKAIPDDKTRVFKNWVQQFADVCKDLGKYQHNLEEECKARWDSCNQQGQKQEAKESVLAEKEGELDTRRIAFDIKSGELAEQKKEISILDSQLAIDERDLQERELNASHGFADQNRKALTLLESQQRELEVGHQSELTRIRDEKAALKDEIRDAERQLAELRNTRSEEEHLRVCELDARDHDVLARELNIKEQTTRLKREWQDLKDAKGNIELLINEDMEQERESHELELGKINRKLDKSWEKIDRLKALLNDFKELESSLGGQTAEDFLLQLEELKQENHLLLRKLEDADTEDYEKQNELLRSQLNIHEKELKDLRPELDQARIEARQKRLAATELQTKEQERRILELHQRTLKVHIDELESRIGQLTDANKTQTPFPAMSDMDTSKDFRSSIELEIVPELKVFAQELQHRIAQAEDSVQLYYPLEDIQVLLGGLAMSQLHVFQGISGTGKTSLAKAFAKAMGGFCTDIAVQAGWRDRDDLIGHYNAFERRYYEKDCLQALYQAQTPRWNDTCNVILLDEMNLSRPEQYFSEFLSALEKNDHSERLISLSETPLPNAPKCLKGGRQILVPSNIWFIGTANHDETTNELADKTYDRSHVMTLPKQDHSFKITPYNKKKFSFNSLQTAFDKAEQSGQKRVAELLGKLTEHNITTQLADTFDLGWGNRFERQAKRFIPVMVACGATEGQALDHLLSTRVMRSGKVTGRYNVNADDIGKLTDSLNDFWSKSGLKGKPTKSLQLLDTDRKRKEHGG
ncbi:MAG: AAA family ATPase [Colwellia sp.]|jgi:Chromosome segregation ATPases